MGTSAASIAPTAQVTTVDFHLTDVAGPYLATTEHPWTDDTSGPYAIPVSVIEASGVEEGQG